MKKLNGVILFEGPSKLTGEPIVAIATFNSNNKKTGDMIQTWILRSDMKPTDAIKSGKDEAVCGSCPHRRSLGGGCYVNVGQAPQAVFAAYKRGSYPQLTIKQAHLFTGRSIRLGSYGDPAAVPTNIWSVLTGWTDGHTGYTHQVSRAGFDADLLSMVMVSADTPKAAMKARGLGQRTFRVKTIESPLLDNEVECAADTVGISCADCQLCHGGEGVSIAINVHGSLAGRYTAKYAKANLINTVAI